MRTASKRRIYLRKGGIYQVSALFFRVLAALGVMLRVPAVIYVKTNSAK